MRPSRWSHEILVLIITFVVLPLNQISGEVSAVMRAIVEIGRQLRYYFPLSIVYGFLQLYVSILMSCILSRENPPREVISMSPAYNYSLIRAAQQSVDPSSGYIISFVLKVCFTGSSGLFGSI